MPINNPMLVRMQKIDYMLKTRKYVSNAEIREALEIKDKKTVYKTIYYMQDAMGAPIDYDKSLKCWYYTEENFSMKTFNMSEGELFSLFIAGKTLEQYKNTPFYNKLSAVFNRIKDLLPEKIQINPDELNNSFYFQPDSFTNYSKEIFDIITKAVKESWELEIEYSAIYSEETITRTIQPYFIFTKHGDWYIYAYCKTRNDFRLFALHRIKKATLTDEVFLKQEDVNPKKVMGEYLDQPSGKGKYDVEIIIKHPTSLYVKERQLHSTQKIEELKDGSIKLSFTVNSLKETQRWVMSMGSDAIVRKPALLKNIIKEEIGLLMENYSL